MQAGAQVLDLNIGPQKKAGAEIMPWMVETVQEVTDVRLSLDTTNAAAMEAGLKACRTSPLINSTDATPERIAALMPLAARFKADLIALTLAGSGLPTSSDARVELATEAIFPAAAEHGIPLEDIFLDPLVLTVNGNQDQALPTIEAVRMFKMISDPPPQTTCGLSNISNSCPSELRPILNRVFLVMMMGAGLDSAIVDALDSELMETIRIVEARDGSTPLGKLFIDLFDAYAVGEGFDASGVDMSDTALRDTVKTIQTLENRTLYAHGYLKL